MLQFIGLIFVKKRQFKDTFVTKQKHIFNEGGTGITFCWYKLVSNIKVTIKTKQKRLIKHSDNTTKYKTQKFKTMYKPSQVYQSPSNRMEHLNTVELQWLEPRWLVDHGWLEHVIESTWISSKYDIRVI